MNDKTIPIPLRPLVHRCETFIGEEDGNYESTTIIVVPVKLSDHGRFWIIKWKCNRSAHCYNKHCIYSILNSRGRLSHEP